MDLPLHAVKSTGLMPYIYTVLTVSLLAVLITAGYSETAVWQVEQTPDACTWSMSAEISAHAMLHIPLPAAHVGPQQSL